jgi:beta-glucosidase-like glycosyl hydrolase
MKKIFLATAFFCALQTAATAQLGDLTKKATTASSMASAAKLAGFDINSLSKGIMGKLTPGLGLTGDQTPKVNDEVMGFLKKKTDIMPLKDSNPAEYAKQQTGLFNNLKNRLGFILKPEQYKKFLELLPIKPDAKNVLSALKF